MNESIINLDNRDNLIEEINSRKFTTIYEAAKWLEGGAERVESNTGGRYTALWTYKAADGGYFAIWGYYEPFSAIHTPPVRAYRCKKLLGYVYVPETMDNWE